MTQLNFCELVNKIENDDQYFGKIKFAIGANVSNSFKKPVGKVADNEWKELRVIKKLSTKPPILIECAKVSFVSNQGSKGKKSPDYRYLVTRQRVSKQMVLNFNNETLGEQLKLPFPTTTMNNSTYKIHGFVTNYSRNELTFRQVL